MLTLVYIGQAHDAQLIHRSLVFPSLQLFFSSTELHMEHVLGFVALAAGLIIGLGAIGACNGIGIMGSK